MSETKEKLKQIRSSFLELHKSLLDYQKKVYEGTQGKISTPAEYFKLVTEDSSFSWLREISQLIVSLDELLESDSNLEQQGSLIAYAKSLLTPDSEGGEFAKKYYVAIQGSPAVALAHSKVISLLQLFSIPGSPKPGKNIMV